MRRLIIVVAVLLAGCSTPGDQAAPPASEAASPDGVPPALAWSGDLVEGGQLDGGDLAGGDVVLWFWAPW